MEYKNSFILYESVFKQYERLLNKGKKQEAQDYIFAVMKYGLYGELPEEDNDVWDYGLDSVIASIESAKGRYSKKINIPREELEKLINEGLCQKEIAKYFNCSVDTIQRRIKQYEITAKKPQENRKPQAQHGTANIPQKDRTQFNDNDNVNVNINKNTNWKSIGF